LTAFATWRSRLPAAIGAWFSRDLSRTAREYVDERRVRLLGVEEARIEGEIHPRSGNGPPFTGVAEWVGGSGPLALRGLCSCGAAGICEHLVALLETVRTTSEVTSADEAMLAWLPQPPLTQASRRARCIWVVFHPLESGGLGALLVLDSPRLRGVIREAPALLSMMESSPADDWDDADRRLLHDETICEAFQAKQNPQQLARAMLRLTRHPRLRFTSNPRNDVHPIELSEFSLDLRGLRLLASRNSAGFAPMLRTYDGERIDLQTLIVLETEPMWAATPHAAYLLDDRFDIGQVLAAARSGVRTPISPLTVARVAPYLGKNDRSELGIGEAERPTIEIALTWLEGALIASLTFVDRATKTRVPFHPHGAVARNGERFLFFPRQLADRTDLRLTQAGFMPRGFDRYALHGADRAAHFVRDVWSQWTDIERRIDRTLEDLDASENRFGVSVSVAPVGGGEVDWFEINVAVSLDNEAPLTEAELESLLAGNGRYADVRGHLVDVSRLRERAELLTDLAAQRRTGLAALLASTDELRTNVEHVTLPPEVAALRERLRNFEGIEPVTLPGNLGTILRSYQQRGVDFLAYLESFGFSGVLADEMGLGKTLQVIAYVLWRRHRDGPAPTLVIAPTSVTHTWETEINRFAPELSILRLQSGSERAERYEQLLHTDIAITSYALARLDAERLAKQRFRLVVLDEAQHAKNPSSQIARVVRALQGEQRLALTGTPIENTLRDLWAIFGFVEPGLLGSESGFRRRFEVPIANGDERAAATLRSRLEPFLLRRTKEEVATELPDRIEAIVECELSPLQLRLYRGVAEAARREVFERLEHEGAEGASIHVLAALTRLRQICAHPGLLFDEYRDTPEASSKLEAFLETVQDVTSGGHRVLVFSAFSAMLKILRTNLARHGLLCAFLDGSTKERDRQIEVERFMADDGPPVFLCSLKAGGVGLTLTAADYVILYDPWWNPAVERQAIDRAHRIGQRRVVTAYRMISIGTVEEKMRALAEQKNTLSKSVIRADSAMAKRLTREDLEALFADPPDTTA